MEEGRNPNGLISLGQRVQMIEKRVKRQEKELQRRGCGEEDHFCRLIGEQVVLQFADMSTTTGELLEVSKFTVLFFSKHPSIHKHAREQVINKSHILRMNREPNVRR